MDNIANTLLNDKTTIIAVAVIAGIFLLVAILLSIIYAYLPIKERRDYIMAEMARSLNEEEYLHWKRELRQLYLGSVPLIGKFFR